MRMDTKELRQRAAERLKWDQATLHQKMGEVVDLAEALRRRLEGPEEVPTDELRVASNELTRRMALIDICGEKFPKEKHRINIVLSIGDDWTNKVSALLKHRRFRGDSSTRRIIQEGFSFLSEHTKTTMLREFNKGDEEVAREVLSSTPTRSNGSSNNGSGN